MANNNVQEIYLAYYGRPADPGGEAYWTDQLDQAGGNLNAVIDAFGNSPEFTERFARLDTEALIAAIYHRLFNRDPDAGGLAFYTDLLESGQKTLGSIALDILNGASGEDVTRLDEKLVAAAEFTRLVEVSGTTYAGEWGITVGSNLIATIGSVWTTFQHAHAEFSAEFPGQDTALWYGVPRGIVPLFLTQLRDDPHYFDLDRYVDFGQSANTAAHLHFDDHLVIDGVLAEYTDFDRDRDSYTLFDLAPGNYEFALSGGTDTMLLLFAYDYEDGLIFRSVIVSDEDRLQIQLQETVDLMVRVSGDQGSGEYRLTITETDETYRAYDLELEPPLYDNAEANEVFYDYLFGA